MFINGFGPIRNSKIKADRRERESLGSRWATRKILETLSPFSPAVHFAVERISSAPASSLSVDRVRLNPSYFSDFRILLLFAMKLKLNLPGQLF